MNNLSMFFSIMDYKILSIHGHLTVKKFYTKNRFE